MSLDDIIKMTKRDKKTSNKQNNQQQSKKPYVTKQALFNKKAQKSPAKPGIQPKRRPGQGRYQGQGGVQGRLGQRRPVQSPGSPKKKTNQTRVNRPSSRASQVSNVSSVSDAKLLKIAKALLSKKVGATMLNQTVAQTTRINQQAERKQQQQQWRRRGGRQGVGRGRGRPNIARTAIEDDSPLLTVSVHNELANVPTRRKRNLNQQNQQNRSPAYTGESIIIETRNPQAEAHQRHRASAATGAPHPATAGDDDSTDNHIKEIVRGMKPKVSRTYDFSQEAFHPSKPSTLLSQRFSQTGSPSAVPGSSGGSRQIFM